MISLLLALLVLVLIVWLLLYAVDKLGLPEPVRIVVMVVSAIAVVVWLCRALGVWV